MLVARLLLLVVLIVGANGLAFSGGAAQVGRVGGEAYGLAVGVPSRPVDGAPYVQLPPDGGSAIDFSAGTGVGIGGDVASVDSIRVTTGGGLTGDGMTVQSTAEIGLIELFTGLVRATNVQVVAGSTLQGGRAFSNGSTNFGSLTVAGLDYTDPAPNTRVELPGVGYVVLNEQLVGGDGQSTASIIVRALRLQVTETIVLDVPQGTEFVVANASSGVPQISASTVVAVGPTPYIPSDRFNPISTRDPVDISIPDLGDELSDNGLFDNDDLEDNDNGDTATAAGGAGGAGGTGRATGGSASVVVTVVVVVTNPTPTRTPTPTPTRTRS